MKRALSVVAGVFDSPLFVSGIVSIPAVGGCLVGEYSILEGALVGLLYALAVWVSIRWLTRTRWKTWITPKRVEAVGGSYVLIAVAVRGAIVGQYLGLTGLRFLAALAIVVWSAIRWSRTRLAQ
jgi:hypothetical protein